jgi:hypothetical protein
MSVAHLTDITVRALKTPGSYFDEIMPAFGIRVGKHRKTWIVVRGPERIRTRIGHYPALSLADARKQALVLLGSPLEKKAGVRNFADALQNFFDIHVPTLKPRLSGRSGAYLTGTSPSRSTARSSTRSLTRRSPRSPTSSPSMPNAARRRCDG